MTPATKTGKPSNFSLANRNILLGISGGIAAYKAAELTRQLVKLNANVRVVMTPAAKEFITPLTLQALSGNAVHGDLLDPEAEAAMGHIELARWADAVLIAPATANTIARLNSGEADDLLTTLCLATAAPVFIAPAMNQAMWAKAATQENCKALQARGITLLGPGEGSQACGDTGMGRLLEPELIVSGVAAQFASRELDGLTVLITAGPTREAIDPVRYLSNHSSGKMGFALAQAAMAAGARTTLIAGPVALADIEGVERINVVSAADMLAAVNAEVAAADIFISCAAVADYTPLASADQKLKKKTASLQLTLQPTADILATVAARNNKPFCVGFAAETQRVEEYARGKLEQKNLDLIVANDVSAPGIGFGSEENAVTVISRENSHAIKQTNKQNLARLLINIVAKAYAKEHA